MPTFRAGFALPLDELRDELDRFWTTLTAAPPLHGWGTRPRAGLFPAVTVRETDDAVTVEAELPGLDTADVEISVAGDELVLKGSRPAAGAETGNGGGTGCEKWLPCWACQPLSRRLRIRSNQAGQG